MLSIRGTAWLASLATFFVAFAAHAQNGASGVRPVDSYNWMQHTNDRMETGLTPLVALVGLGLLFAIVVALVASIVMASPWRRRVEE
jgi:hypothetical protein